MTAGILRPGDEMISIAGPPYDTLEEVIGQRGDAGSGAGSALSDFNIGYRCVRTQRVTQSDLRYARLVY